MGDTEEYQLFSVKIDLDPDKRIDKSRVGKVTISSLHPAELQDAGKPTRAVAKITNTRGQPRHVVEKLKECTELHKKMHNHPSITKVVGSLVNKNEYMLFMEEAEASLRDIISPTTPEAVALREEIEAGIGLREVIRLLFVGLAYIHSNVDDHKNKISHRDIKPDNIMRSYSDKDG